MLALQVLLAGAALFYADLEAGRGLTLFSWAALFVLLPIGRAASRKVLDTLGLWQQDALFIGTGANAREACLALMAEAGMGYRIRALITAPGEPPAPAFIDIKHHRLPVLQNGPLEAELARFPHAHIVLALDHTDSPQAQALIQQLTHFRHRLHLIPALRGLPLYGTQLSYFFSHQVLFLSIRNNLGRRSYRWLKRGFDILAAGLLLILLSPVMAYVAWRIYREDGAPVIFRQPRVAQGGGQFGFLKFRSMVRDADVILERWKQSQSPEWQRYYAQNFKLDDDPRVLKCGRWIRRTSLDELPQLINVLRGEMSLVGPRPLLERELNDYGDSINYYTQAKPGITGLWQISGRSNTTFLERAVLDQWYVQNWSLWYDVAILFRTVDVVLNRRGAH
jgi:undecaprenyl-phosphate galactose phosphotransferase